MVTRINIAGLGDVAPEAHWPQTKLTTAAQGTSSLGTIVLRDFGQDPRDFITGKRIEVDRGPGTENVWAGYVMRAARRFWFPVDDPDKLHRQWLLSVVDNNILFNKRVVFKQSAPGTVKGPAYNTDTYDDDVIDELVTNWLDLSTDGIDTSSLVDRVALSNVGQPFYPINGGMRWGEAMQIIAWLPAAVWYLTPAWKLVYADVDIEDAIYDLSDQPGPGQASYRELVILNDAAQLANDIAGWGFGKGSNHGVFRRYTDATSIADHGLWQDAFQDYGVYKQTTIDRMVDSALNGSPSSKRGHKNDRFEVDLSTHVDGFVVGQKARFISHQWGEDIVLPIRVMELEFESPTAIKYNMKLSHEIDPRWTMFDPLPPIHIPNNPIVIPGVYVPPTHDTGDPQCTEGICGITDSFGGRTTSSPALGIADCGLTYGGSVVGSATQNVAAGVGILFLSNPSIGATAQTNASLSPWSAVWDRAAIHSIQFSISAFDSTFAVAEKIEFAFAPYGTLHSVRVVIIPSNSSLWGASSQITFTSDLTSGTTIPLAFWVPGTVYTLSVTTSGSTIVGSITDGSSTYSTSLGSVPAVITSVSFNSRRDFASPFAETVSQIIIVNNLVVPEVNRCAAPQFEDFKRTIAPGTSWGDATPSGKTWVTNFIDHALVSVDDGHAEINVDSTSGIDDGAVMEMFGPGPWTTLTGFTMRSWFRFENVRFGGVPAAVNPTMRWPGIENSGGVGSFDEWVFDGTDVWDYQSSGITTSTHPFVIVPGVTYNVRWDYRCDLPGLWDGTTWSGLNQLTIDNGAFAWVFNGYATVFPVSSNFLILVDRVPGGTVSWDSSFGPIDFEYEGRPCYVGGPDPVTVALAGEIIEDITVSMPTFYVGAPFIPGSTLVWLAGVLQTDYTEYPELGTIVLGFDPVFPTPARVRYVVA